MDLRLHRFSTVLHRLHLQSPSYKVVQVLGTNGKGSTSTFISHLASSHDLVCGLYSSPHLVDIRERIQVNGHMLSETEWLAAANSIIEAGGDELTYFEWTSCLALLLFARHNVQLAVLEAGLGGIADATTAVRADLTVITPIDLDHTALLGTSRSEVARNKAGAIRTQVPVLTVKQDPEVHCILAQTAAQHHTQVWTCAPCLPLSTPTDTTTIHWPHDELPHLSLPGEHQYGNAALALAAFRLIHYSMQTEKAPDTDIIETIIATSHNSKAEEHGLNSAWLPGRMHAPAITTPIQLPWAQKVSLPPLLLDGAHNSHSMAALGLSLAKQGIAPIATIFTCMQDKDYTVLISHLCSMHTGAIFIPPLPDIARACDAAELAQHIGLNAFTCASLQDAITQAALHVQERMPEAITAPSPRHPLLVCGSFYLLGAVYAALPQLLAPPQRQP